MPWEQRRQRRYYYRAQKRQGRVAKQYVGNDALAELVAASDTAQRYQREEAAEAWRKQREDLVALDAQFSAWWEASEALIQGLLYGAGCYRHARGHWRKRRL
jgi:hypothetical protein